MRRWIKKRIHISWFIACASLGFLVGVALSSFAWGAEFANTAWLIVSGSIFAAAVLKHKAPLILLGISAGVIFGLWRGAVERQDLTSYQTYYGKTFEISGKITEDTSYGTKGDQRFRLGNPKILGRALPEEIWVSTPSSAEIKRGDIVVIEGRLDKGFGNIPASVYRANIIKVVRPYPGDIGRRIRDSFAGVIRRAIPDPEASLGIGYLVGQRSTLPEGLDQQIKTVGLTHAVVASGYNLTILVVLACKLFAKKSKYLAALSGSVMIVGFILITGFSPSMSRAGLVSALTLTAWYYGRKIHPLVLLSFAAAVTVLIKPAYIWGDIGWSLSFAAFAGVIILAPLLHHYFWGAYKKPHMLRELIVGAVSAQVTTLPIILMSFHQYSQYALPANLLVLPLVPLAMLLTFFAGIFGLFAPGMAHLAGIPATIVLHYMVKIIEFIANLPNAKSEVIFALPTLVGVYILLIFVIVFLRYKTQHKFRAEPAKMSL
jgi:competence protein ComEC